MPHWFGIYQHFARVGSGAVRPPTHHCVSSCVLETAESLSVSTNVSAISGELSAIDLIVQFVQDRIYKLLQGPLLGSEHVHVGMFFVAHVPREHQMHGLANFALAIAFGPEITLKLLDQF